MSVALSREPRHRQLSHLLRKRLIADELRPGDRFLSVRDISREYAVSPVTAHKSMQELIAEDVLIAKPAKGYFVGAAAASAMGGPVGRSLITVLAGEALRDSPRVLSFDVLRGLRERVPGAHIRQEFLPYGDPSQFLEAMLDRDRGIVKDRVFVLPSPDPAVRQFAVDRGLPAVVIGSLEEGTNLPSVQFDEFKLAYTATCILLAKGHKSVFFLDRDTWVYGNKLRYEGFAKAMLEEGIIADRSETDRFYIRVPADHSHAIATVERVLKKSDGLMAIVANADRYAAWAIRTASARQLRIPDDLMLISLEGGELAEQLTPRLTSIPECGYEVGISVGNFVEKLLQGQKITHPRSIINADIVQRETTYIGFFGRSLLPTVYHS